MIEIIREETLKEREERRKKEQSSKKGQASEKRAKERTKHQGHEAVEAENENYEEKQQGICGLPKNIRQIGDSSGVEKIYIEDYVMTHMKQLAAYGDEKPKVLILYGQREIIDGQLFWFISGAVQAEAIDSFMDKIVFDEKLWIQINETANRFFNGLAILGWAFLKKSGDSYWDEMISSTHRKFFRPDQKIFFEYIMNERMENMYLFENGKMDRQSGFYIYYERNEPMQNYMLAYKEEETEQVEEFTGDQATKQFRAIVQEKKEQMRRRHTMGLLYGTSAILVMVIMVIGITMLNNYEKMQNMEKVLYEISGQMEEVQAVETGEELVSGKATVDTGNDVVETTAGVITKNPDAEIDGSKEDSNSAENENSQNSSQEAAYANAEENGNPDSGEAAAGQDNGVNEETAANANHAAAGEESGEPGVGTNAGESGNGEDQQNEAAPDNAADPNSASKENAAEPDNKSNEAVENSEGTLKDGQATETAASIPKEYIIQKGDTLAKISRKFYGTENMIKKICELNHIQDMDNILYGEKILLP